jgi:hypothetical protein
MFKVRGILAGGLEGQEYVCTHYYFRPLNQIFNGRYMRFAISQQLNLVISSVVTMCGLLDNYQCSKDTG